MRRHKPQDNFRRPVKLFSLKAADRLWFDILTGYGFGLLFSIAIGITILLVTG